MDKYKIIRKIEEFAPLQLAESWDCSGWASETANNEISSIMLCLTVTDSVIKQAKEHNCDMIISHHPLFYVPLSCKNIDIYTAHTNLDRTKGGTTDTLINQLGFKGYGEGFLRYVDCEISLDDLIRKLRKISPNLRYVNNSGQKRIKKTAFCAGSGAEFINEAFENGADALVTGDLKFHASVESPITLVDIGHFESEILVLSVIENLLQDIKTVRAIENSPFKY